MVCAHGGHADTSEASGPTLVLLPRAHWKICQPVLETNSLSMSYMSSTSAESRLPETPARAGEGLSIHLLWHSDLAGTGRGGCGCRGPRGWLGPSACALCCCLGKCLSALELSAAAAGFFGGWRVVTVQGLFFFLKSSALSHCKYQQSCSLCSWE